MTADPESQTRFGTYTIIRRLARGGISSVSFAKKDGVDEPCVLKLLLGEHASNEALSRRFRREAVLSGHLHHPNIARVLDSGTEGETFFIAFEFIAGQTLTSLLARLHEAGEWLPPSISLRIAIDVLDGLAHAHSRLDADGRPLSLVHRDLSPNNIMLAYDGTVKIIDFGLAAAKVDDFKTRAGQFIGTVRYMSPEQAMTRPVDRRSDLYTVAVVLWEMIAEKRMVGKGTMKEMLANICVRHPPRLSSIVPSIGEPLGDVLAKALDKDPDRRYQSAEELAADIRAALAAKIAEPAEIAKLLDRLFPREKEESRELVATAKQFAPTDPLFPVPKPLFENTVVVPTIPPMTASHTFTQPPKPAPLPKAMIAAVIAPIIASIVVIIALLLTQQQPNLIVVPKKPTARPVQIELGELEALLSQLRDSPKDGALLLELEEKIEKRAAVLPEAEREAIRRELETGRREGDVEAVARALARLAQAGR